MKKRRLPASGIQTFRKIRENYDVYIDKTMHIYDLTQDNGATFLSRPRRFGKSLLCSTIASLFRGEKELFEGLAISNTDWEWKTHPVIHIDLGAGNYTKDGASVLKSTLNEQLERIYKFYNISETEESDISVKFTRIIKELSEKLGLVVIIIDEYDNPLLNTIDQPELNKELREILKGFYSVIKQNDQYLRFAFITGVTKFAQVSMFSGMNQPRDITMMPDYCDICGITQEELETFFAPEIEAYSEKYGGKDNYLQKLKDYYNGYYFTRKKLSVYNTYGILHHFNNEAEFAPFWSLSGAPTLIPKYLEMKNIDIVEIEDARMYADAFANYRDNTISLFPLLYQAGYLTISDYDEATGSYRLNYPNVEIRQSLAKFLSSNYSDAEKIQANSPVIEFIEALQKGNVDGFMKILKWYLANVDYSLSSKITEYYVEFAVSNIINMLGLVCKNEVHTSHGRMDSVIEAGAYIYIIEFKVDKPVAKALLQIKEKDYALIYEKSGKKIVKIGVVFSRKMRNIISWKVAKNK